MKSNFELLKEFMNSKGETKKMWKLLYIELLYNNPVYNSDIVREINSCLANNINLDLSLDIIDFCLDYGKKDIIDRISICLDLNQIYNLNSNKRQKMNSETANKNFYLIKKWSDNLGNNYPKFKEIYDKIKIKKYISKIKKEETYLKFITEEDISDEKFIFEFFNQPKIKNNNELNETIFNVSFIEKKEIIAKVDKEKEELKKSEQFKGNINKVEEEKNIIDNNSLFNIIDGEKDFDSSVIGEINQSNLHINLKERIKRQKKVKNKKLNKKLNFEGGNTDDGNIFQEKYNAGNNIDPNIGFNIKKIENKDNNGSIRLDIVFNNKENLNVFSDKVNILSVNNDNNKELKLKKEEKNEKEEKYENFNINKNNNSHSRKCIDNNLNNLLSDNGEKNCTFNVNLINNNLNNNYNFIIEKKKNPNYFILDSNYNNDNNKSQNNNEKLKSMKKSNYSSKKFKNYLNNYSELNNINLESYKEKIESEIKNLNSRMKEGFKNNGNLKDNVDNLRKELSICDKLIDYYKNDKNNDKSNIAKKLKASILKLIGRYDEFIKNNSN